MRKAKTIAQNISEKCNFYCSTNILVIIWMNKNDMKSVYSILKTIVYNYKHQYFHKNQWGFWTFEGTKDHKELPECLYTGSISLNLLQGNLFQMMQISFQESIGYMASYTHFACVTWKPHLKYTLKINGFKAAVASLH